ncbi:MAG TPA: exopolysaccharide biosynthesis polyprenyl glycosylphosphotransferase [Jiangellales bacterium]|nr:exopolysaccharide biosynthesis polyprenyl glycosylphosphotransferase [Jiangellales bacterium]
MTSADRWTTRRIRLIQALNDRGIRLLHLADIVVIYLTLIAVTGVLSVVRTDFNAWAHLPRYWWSYAIITALHLVVFYIGGLYDRDPRLGSRTGLPKIVMLVWLSSLIAGLVSWLLGEFLIPRSILLAYALVAPLGLAANRRLSRWLRMGYEGPPRVLLVGDDRAVELATRHLHDANAPVIVVGSCPSVDGLEKHVDALHATDVLLLDGRYLEHLYAGPLARLEQAGVAALQVVSAHDSLLGLRSIGEIGGIPYVALSSHVLRPSQARLKRWMDLVILALTAPLILPALAFTTAYVAVVVGRPLLFVQLRAGRAGKPFRMLKFRSMRLGAEAEGEPVQAAVKDPRIVRGMGWIRQTRLDELPQLWNVLRGQMSIVGPRPERPEELRAYEQQIPGYGRRHQVPPGITGLAQVYGHYHTDPEYKLGHDLHYLANWSPVLDLQILVRTAWVVLSRRN